MLSMGYTCNSVLRRQGRTIPEFEASLGYIERFFLKTKPANKRRKMMWMMKSKRSRLKFRLCHLFIGFCCLLFWLGLVVVLTQDLMYLWWLELKLRMCIQSTFSKAILRSFSFIELYGTFPPKLEVRKQNHQKYRLPSASVPRIMKIK